jgi:UDP-N-acetylglucosamine 4-epimerase
MYETQFHVKPLSEFSFLITGGAGFIGSHLIEYLLKHGAGKVRVLDNLLTGSEENVKLFQSDSSYEFINGDIRNVEACLSACEGVDYVLHEAALGSVQRSIIDPATTHAINATGFLNMISAAKQKGVKRFVYASSSSVYGDHPALPKKEDQIGKPLSPYAVSKYSNELYANVFATAYRMEVIGLRYFNIFGSRQDTEGPYAAVIPAFIRDMKKGIAPIIYGDGSQSRDFTFIENAVQANIKALFAMNSQALSQVYNIAFGAQHTILQLFELLKKLLMVDLAPQFEPSRKGDITHSLADISKAGNLLTYHPSIDLEHGLKRLL